jgi:hypothetical protein
MDSADLVRQIDSLVPVDVKISREIPDLRVRHVVKYGLDCYFLFNEGQNDLEVRLSLSAEGRWFQLDAQTGRRLALDKRVAVRLARHEMKVLLVV